MPPQNDEAEVAVLGTVLMTEQALDQILVDLQLSAEDFYRPRHQLIFRAMVAPQAEGGARGDRRDHGLRRPPARERARGGGRAGLRPLAAHAGAVGPRGARLREDRARPLDPAQAARHRARDPGAGRPPRAAIRGRWSSRPSRRSSAPATTRTRASCDRSRTCCTTSSTSSSGCPRRARALTGTPSGFKDLDEITGGFQPGNLIVLAARPAMGKSALATNIAENASVDHGKAVALFSLEMSEGELAQRFIASRAKINGELAAQGPGQGRAVAQGAGQATEKLTKAPLFVDDSSDLGVLELRAKARRLHNAAPAGTADRRLPAAHAPGGPARRPRRAGRQDQPRAQDPGARAAASR